VPSELFTNLATTTIVSGANTAPAAGTSEAWVITSAAGFPAASNAVSPKTQFRAVVHDDVAVPTQREIVTVTHVSGSTFTVTRGVEGSTIFAHPAGHRITHIVSAEVLLGATANVEYLVAASTAPARVKARADWVCTGLSDEVEINLAITAANAAGGGVVRLTPGTFNIGNFNTGPVKMRRKVELIGAGREATFLVCGGTWAGHDAIAQGGMIEPFDNSQDRWAVRRMTLTAIWGDHDTRAIYFNISSNTGFVYGDDSMIVLDSLYIRGFKRTALDGRGAYSRKNTIIDVQIFNCGDTSFFPDGVYWESNDSHFFGLDVGLCTGYGINLNGPNNRFVSCKAWYNKKSGWFVDEVRNQLAACEAQDNKEHGFLIAAADNTLSACLADSNSYDGSPAGTPTGQNFDGFRVTAPNNTLAACNAKDKNEGARTIRQKYGFYLDTGVERVQIHGIANDNLTGIIGGVGIDGAFNNIQLTGSQGGVDANFVRFVGSAMGSEITFWRSEAAAAVAGEGLDLAQAKTELSATQKSTRKRVESLDIGSTVQLAVTMRNMAATADTVTVTICDAATPANVLATCVCSVAAAINTVPYLGAYAAKPSWFTATTDLAVFVSHTGAATLDYIFKDVTLRQRP
jgi:hypothetical protein